MITGHKLCTVMSRGLTLIASTVYLLAISDVCFAVPETGPMTVKVRVETKPEPTKAIGMLLSTHGAAQIAETTIQKVGDKLYDVIFTIDRSMLTEDTVATAMAISSGGDITFANVTPSLLSDSRLMVANIPECPSEDTTNFATINQLAPLKSLVDIRSARAELAQLRVSRALNEELIGKLRRFEEAFGLTQSEELSMSLSPQDLVDRLARIDYAVRQYRVFKKQPGA